MATSSEASRLQEAGNQATKQFSFSSRRKAVMNKRIDIALCFVYSSEKLVKAKKGRNDPCLSHSLAFSLADKVISNVVNEGMLFHTRHTFQKKRGELCLFALFFGRIADQKV